MSGIESVGMAVPGPGLGVAEIASTLTQWLADDTASCELAQRLARSVGAETRYFALSPPEILHLEGLAERARLFEELAPPLGSKAAEEALRAAGCPPEEVATLIFTSCSVPTIPAVDAQIIERAGLRHSTFRVPLFQQGCAGGMVGLSLAGALAEQRGPVLLCSVELCSLVFQRGDRRTSQLVGAALFGDGAAAALVTPGGGRLKIHAARSELLPGTRQLMGYDLFDDGFHLRLDRELPQCLVRDVPRIVDEFLSEHGTSREALRFWLVHPGGPKILDALSAALGLGAADLRWSREMLRRYGNLSSASVLMTTKLFLDSGEAERGTKGLLLGVGPGLTLELLLLEVRK